MYLGSDEMLYICPTPIGNLDDITIRVLNTLKEVDVVACEDTRHSLRLLNHFEIKKPLISYHEHNKDTMGKKIIERMLQGETFALVSDAGMPGISDPGEDLVKLCIENNIPFNVLPGASAAIIALVGSGMDTRKFVFEGFLDRDKKKKKEALENIKYEQRTMIFYESPHRLKDTLKAMFSILGDRNISVARELTKKYEETLRGPISKMIEHYQANDPRGEYVLILEGSSEVEVKEDDTSHLSIEEHVQYLMDKGSSKKDAIKMVAKKMGLPKNEVYQKVIDL